MAVLRKLCGYAHLPTGPAGLTPPIQWLLAAPRLLALGLSHCHLSPELLHQPPAGLPASPTLSFHDFSTEPVTPMRPLPSTRQYLPIALWINVEEPSSTPEMVG